MWRMTDEHLYNMVIFSHICNIKLCFTVMECTDKRINVLK